MNKLGVFNTPVYRTGRTISHRWGDYAKFSNDEQAKAAAHAINNHDQLVSSLGDAISWLSIDPQFHGSPLQEKLTKALKEAQID